MKKRLGMILGAIIMATLFCIGGSFHTVQNLIAVLTDKEEIKSEGTKAKSEDAVSEEVMTKSENHVGTGGVFDHQLPSFGGRYYFSLLNDEERAFYLQIEEAVARSAESVTVNMADIDRLDMIVESVLMDCPQYFWCGNSYTYRQYAQSTELNFQYNCTGEEKERRSGIIQRTAEEMLQGLPVGEDDYKKIKYVFEKIIAWTDYRPDCEDNQNIYSVFGNRESVCAGYAKATKYLLDQAGIECIYISGTAKGGGKHAWNIVQCNGDYYYVDTTWGDPVYLEEVQRESAGISEEDGGIAYEYLCCSNQMLAESHTVDDRFLLPECTDTSYEYYRMQGRYYEAVNAQSMLELIKADIDAKAPRTDMQFGNAQLMDKAKGIWENEIKREAMDYLAEQYNLGYVNVVYQYMERSNRITLYWKYS